MRRWAWLPLVGVTGFACSSGEAFKRDGAGGAGQSGAAGANTAGAGGSAGSTSGGSQSQAGETQEAGSAGTASGGATTGGSGGKTGGDGGMGGTQCPPCAAPPSADCVGSGPCGCGPYECPNGGASGDGIPCGATTCSPPMVCCNSLLGTCTLPDQVCGA